jgi:hypothetical protein
MSERKFFENLSEAKIAMRKLKEPKNAQIEMLYGVPLQLYVEPVFGFGIRINDFWLRQNGEIN